MAATFAVGCVASLLSDCLTSQFASSDPDAVLPVSDRFIVKASDVLTVFDHVLADQTWTHLEREGVRAALV